jgi:hypothetical protein
MLNYQRVTHHPTFWGSVSAFSALKALVFSSKFQAFYGDRGDVQGAFQAHLGMV